MSTSNVSDLLIRDKKPLKYNAIAPCPNDALICDKEIKLYDKKEQKKKRYRFNKHVNKWQSKAKGFARRHKKRLSKENITIAVVFLVFVFARAMDRVFAKRVNDRMLNYNMLYVGIIWPIAMLFVQWLMGLGYVMYYRYVMNDINYNLNWFSWRSPLASTRGSYSQWKISQFALWDQLNATIITLPAPFLSLTAQGLLSNTSIIFTMILSIIWLKTRYTACHYIGSCLIIISGLISITVEIQNGGGFSYKDDQGLLHKTSFMWYFIYIIGCTPNAMSSCFKQKCLKEANLDVMWASTWSGVWQVFWGILMFSFNWIPLPEPAVHYTPAGTGEYFVKAWQCFFGIAPTQSKMDLVCVSDHGAAYEWFIAYVVFNLLFNVLVLWLTKKLSATWSSIATTLCLDLASIMSMSTVLMGKEAAPLTYEQWMGLIVAALAMWVYNLEEELDENGQLVRGTCDDHDEYEQVDDCDDIIMENNSVLEENIEASGNTTERGASQSSPTSRSSYKDNEIDIVDNSDLPFVSH